MMPVTSPPCSSTAFGERAHQADRAAAIDQPDAVLGEDFAEASRRFDKGRVGARARSAIDAERIDFAHGLILIEALDVASIRAALQAFWHGSPRQRRAQNALYDGKHAMRDAAADCAPGPSASDELCNERFPTTDRSSQARGQRRRRRRCCPTLVASVALHLAGRPARPEGARRSSPRCCCSPPSSRPSRCRSPSNGRPTRSPATAPRRSAPTTGSPGRWRRR